MITFVRLIIPLLLIAMHNPQLSADEIKTPRVVLVHGFMKGGTIFKVLQKKLEANGIECMVARMEPSDGRGGLEYLATLLSQQIDAKFGEKKPFQIISYSMGGLISRYYLQELGKASRCRQFITIATPHHGTQTAYFYPSLGAQQMRPNSNFLKALAESETRLGDLPITSYRTPLDLMILPSNSSIWPRADNYAFPVALHPMMVSDRRVVNDIWMKIQER